MYQTKENKVLIEEVADLRDQITEGNKSMAEIEKVSDLDKLYHFSNLYDFKAKYYLEKERNELQRTLTQKEDLLEQLEAKTVQYQLNLKKCKTDMESM